MCCVCVYVCDWLAVCDVGMCVLCVCVVCVCVCVCVCVLYVGYVCVWCVCICEVVDDVWA